MEKEPNASSYSEIANRVDDTEMLISVSYKRLITQATDWALDRGGLAYINGRNDRASDIYEFLQTGTHNSTSKIEFIANTRRNNTPEPDFTSFYLGINVRNEVDYQDLPIDLIKAPNQNDHNQEEDDEVNSNSSPEEIDEDAECIEEINIFINFDTNNFFTSDTYVSYEINGFHYQAINQDEEETSTKSRTNDEIDEYLSKTMYKLEQDIAIDQMEQASKYLSMLMDRSFGGIQ